jgi:hypothetical protein
LLSKAKKEIALLVKGENQKKKDAVARFSSRLESYGKRPLSRLENYIIKKKNTDAVLIN